MLRRTLLLSLALSVRIIASAQTATSDSLAVGKKLIQRCADGMNWSPSNWLPPGALTSVLEGDPSKEGIFTTRLKLPPDYMLPPHTHPKDERITVLSGTVYLGFGDTVDTASATAFGPGCYYVNPTGAHHYVFTKGEGAEVQLTGPGPWGIDFISR